MRARLQQALQASQQSEAASLAREARLHTSLEAANVGTWDWNIRTGEVRWSDTLERIHGQSPGGFRGTFEGFLDGVHPEDRQRVLDAIDRARTAGAAYVIEYRSLVQGDDVRWFEGRGHVIPNEAGEPVWMSGICMDVTDLRPVSTSPPAVGAIHDAVGSVSTTGMRESRVVVGT